VRHLEPEKKNAVEVPSQSAKEKQFKMQRVLAK
jgi:hypothetical protein